MNTRICFVLACAMVIALLPTAHAQNKNSELEHAQALLAAGDNRGAIDAFTKVIALTPGEGLAYQGRGQARVNLKDYAGGIKDYDQALKLDPSNASAYNLRGFARMRNSDPKGAKEDFARCMELNPGYVPVHTNQGILLRSLGDNQGAMQDYNRALEIAPKNERALTERANLKLSLGDAAGALTDYSAMIETNPKNATAYNLRGIARKDSGDAAGAMADYNRAIELDPRFVAPRSNRAYLRMKSGDTDGAMADYNRALEIAPKNEFTLLWRGFLKFNQGDNAGAIADYNTVIDVNPKNAGAHFNRGLAREKLGDRTEALADFQNALALDPTLTSAKSHVTALQASVGASARPTTIETKPLGQVATTKNVPSASRVVSTADESPATSVPAKAATASVTPIEPSVSQRVLAPFKGYAEIDPCQQAEKSPGAPWRADASTSSGPVGSAQLGQYQALLRHTMEGLRLLYGMLTPTEDKNFSAFWAPYFDHPTKEALNYFQQITPLLDEMTVTLSNLDGLLPGMGEALQGTMLAGGDPSSAAACVAAVQYRRVKTERARLDDLSKKVSALGNPPNPLAAKCAAHQRHRKAVLKEEDIIALLKTAQFFHVDTIQNNTYVFFSTDKNTTGVGHFVRQSLIEWNWNGSAFKFCEQDSDYESPPVEGVGRARIEVAGNLSPDGKTIESLTYKDLVQHFDSSTNQIVGPRVAVELEIKNIPLLSVTTKPDRKEIAYDVKGTAVTKCITRLKSNLTGFQKGDEIRITFVLGEKPFGPAEVDQMITSTNKDFFAKGAAAQSDNASNPFAALGNRPSAEEEKKANEERVQRLNALNAIAQKKADASKRAMIEGLGDEWLRKTDAELDAQAAAIQSGKPVAVQAAAAPGNDDATAAGAGSQQAGKAKSQDADPEIDPKVTAEAIAEHLALAEQTRREADRWAADAAKEPNQDQRERMQRSAAAKYANAQSERDIAESLRTGTMVHTRTDWDEQQHQTTVSNIKKELAVFNAENKLIANLPKVGDMVTGVEGLQLREQMQKDITDAIHSSDPVKNLAAIYGKVQDKVIDQGQQQIEYAQDRVDRWESRVAIAEKVEMGAGMSVTLGALWAPAEIGTLALGYAGSTGFAEGGVKGATVAVVRGVSSRADIIISAYEGATKIDPVTKQPGGVWGAAEGALWSIGTNKAFEVVGGRIQQAKAEYAAAHPAVATENVPIDKAKAESALSQQAAGGTGVAPVAQAGKGRLKEFDFQTPEQRYKTELENAKTPQEQEAVSQKYAIQEKRAAMGTEKNVALQRAEEAVRQGGDPAAAKEQYNKDLKSIDAKYADPKVETRNQEHQKVMEELGFDPSYDTNNKDIKPTGSKPTTAESDMDFTPVGSTPHEAYQKGKAYTEALKKRGHTIDEYGDRWIDTTTDATIWKPGFGADKPGSSSFDAEVIFGSLPNSDKFGTKGGIEWTSSETHTTDDPLGAVLANVGKAAGAGLGNSRPPDLHVIGKSASKAVEILSGEKIAISVDAKLKTQIEALRKHQTPEQAGVVDLGADQATKDKQVKAFMDKVQVLMGRAIGVAKAKSDQNARAFERQAASGTPEQAFGIRSKFQAYQASDQAAMATIAEASPGLAGDMVRSVKPADLIPSDPALSLNIGGLTRALAQDRDSDAKAPSAPADSSDPAFVDLGKRCTLAAQNASAKLAAAKPGSDEARYLAELKTALEQGGKNPAEAVRTVRGLSGTELAVVLAQLGAPAK